MVHRWSSLAVILVGRDSVWVGSYQEWYRGDPGVLVGGGPEERAVGSSPEEDPDL